MTDHRLNELAFEASQLFIGTDPSQGELREAAEWIRQTVHELRKTCCIDCGIDVDPRVYRCENCLAQSEQSDPYKAQAQELRRLGVETLKAARLAQEKLLSAKADLVNGEASLRNVEQIGYVGEWIVALLGDWEGALGDEGKEASDDE